MEIITNIAENYRHPIIALLASQRLPTADLPPLLNDFSIALEGGQVAGVCGLEIYGEYGLLRSLAVDPQFRDKGTAAKLLAQTEAAAKLMGLREIYLLTETAPDYFLAKGYQKITRSDVPARVQASSEFKDVCPQSAIVMKKGI